MLLEGIFAIGFKITKVVKNIYGRGQERECPKGRKGQKPGSLLAPLMGRKQRNPEEQVFAPLVRSQLLPDRAVNRFQDGPFIAPNPRICYAPGSSMNARSYLRLTLIAYAIKILLACFFPLLSDEAHHILWGMFPNYGYGDHPAMTGWFQAAFLWLGASPFTWRLSCLLATLFVTEGLRRVLSPYGTDKARLIAALFTLSPINFLHLIFTPEVPLLVFVFLAFVALFRAHKDNSFAWALLAGLFQAAAIVSKYNAFWFGAAAFYFFVLRPGSRSAKLTLAYGLGCLPAFALIGLYNFDHCWINLNRTIHRMNGKDWNTFGPLLAIAHQLYVGTPWLWRAFFARNERNTNFVAYRRILPLFLFIPILLLIWVSLQNKIGVHWMQAYYVFFFMLLVEANTAFLRRCLRYNIAFLGLHAIPLIGLIFVTPEWVGTKSPRYHHDVVMSLAPQDVCDAFQNFAGPDATLATFDYSQSSVLWVACQKPVLRYGYGALDGREFDRIADYRVYDGKPMAVIWQKPISPKKLSGGLRDARFGSFTVHGKAFHAAVGIFDFETYKANVLRRQLDSLYDPAKRKLPNDRCYFKHRYFPELFSNGH
jgi:hypothetical protein